mgnify:CR=1 FL=1
MPDDLTARARERAFDAECLLAECGEADVPPLLEIIRALADDRERLLAEVAQVDATDEYVGWTITGVFPDGTFRLQSPTSAVRRVSFYRNAADAEALDQKGA